MKYYIKNYNDSGKLSLEGELGIESAGELKEIFINLLEKVKRLSLNIDKLETAHVACLQVICSAHRTFLNLGRPFCLESAAPPVFIKIIEETGFSRDKGCVLDSSQSCIFAAGEKQ